MDHSMATNVRGPLPGIGTKSDMLIYFANWDDFTVREAEKYDIIILHPGMSANTTQKHVLATSTRHTQ